MRRENEVQDFTAAMYDEYGEENPIAEYRVACWEACIPKTFWDVTSKDVSHNEEVFNKVVIPYRKRWKKAMKKGYSLLFVGDNGSGKTMFISYLLTQMIKRGLTTYYTTLTQLDIDIKMGFRDNDIALRLEYMLESDFVAIDEIGKESFKTDGYMTTRLEHYLKKRYDDAEPVLLSSNIDIESLCKMYGSTIESMFDGKYRTVSLEPGDFRKSTKARMKRDMGYK